MGRFVDQSRCRERASKRQILKPRRAVDAHEQRARRCGSFARPGWSNLIGGIVSSGHGGSSCQAALELAEILGPEHVPVRSSGNVAVNGQTTSQAFVGTRYCAGSSLKRRKKRARPSLADGAQTPTPGSTTEFGGALKIIDDLSTVTIASFAARTASLGTADDAPHQERCHGRSAFCAWMTVRSGRCAGIR